MDTSFKMGKLITAIESAADGANSLLVCVVARKDDKDDSGHAIVFAAHGALSKKDFVIAGREVLENGKKIFPPASGVLQ